MDFQKHLERRTCNNLRPKAVNVFVEALHLRFWRKFRIHLWFSTFCTNKRTYATLERDMFKYFTRCRSAKPHERNKKFSGTSPSIVFHQSLLSAIFQKKYPIFFTWDVYNTLSSIYNEAFLWKELTV